MAGSAAAKTNQGLHHPLNKRNPSPNRNRNRSQSRLSHQSEAEADAPAEEALPEHESVEMEEKLIPETVHCAICRKSLKLDDEEQKRGIYFCPYCNREVDHIHDAD